MQPGLATRTALPILKAVGPTPVIGAALMATATRVEQEPHWSTRPSQAPDTEAASLHTVAPKLHSQDQ